MKVRSFVMLGIAVTLAIAAGAQSKGDGSTQRENRSYARDNSIVVDVWSSSAAESADAGEGAELSQTFAIAGLNAASRLKITERKIANSIKMGFPLGEFWIKTDLDSVDELLRVAELSAVTNSDREALLRLREEDKQLKDWSTWLIEQNREMRLAEYYISSTTLDRDERFQATVSCTDSLISMLSSRRLSEGSSCR